MSHRHTHVDIPLRVDGKLKFIKGVTKLTTCGDVLKMLLKKDIVDKDEAKAMSYGIFESSRGIERLLPGKTRLLKVMRTWGTTVDYEFVLRNVNPVMSMPKVSEAKRRKLSKLGSRNVPNAEVNKENDLDKNVISWTMNSESTATVNAFSKQDSTVMNTGLVHEIYFSETDNTMHKCLSNGNKTHITNVKDDIPHERSNIPSVSDVCHDAMSRECNDIPSVSDFETSRNVTGESCSLSDQVHSKNVTMTPHINQVKYAIRKPLKSKSMTTTSTHSNHLTESVNISRNPENIYHSTPSNYNKRCKVKRSRAETVKHKILAQTIKSQISQMSQKEGKEAILQKYFSDYLLYRSPKRMVQDTRYRGRGDGAECEDASKHVRRGNGSDYIANHVNCAVTESSNSTDIIDLNANIPSAIAYETNFDTNDKAHVIYLKSDFTSPLAERPTDPKSVRNPTLSRDTKPDMNGVNLDVTGDSGQEDCDNYFDVAFLDENLEVFIDERVEDDTQCSRKLVDYSLTESDISEIECDNSDRVSNASSASDIIKNIFSDNVDVDADDAMESFMVTKLAEDISDDISDEGLSSLGSDVDHEKEYVV